MTLTTPAPASVGPRLVAALVSGTVAAGAVGVATAWVSDTFAGELSDSATTALILAEVYLCVAVALVAVFGRTRADRERVLALRRPPKGALWAGAVAWIVAYAVAAVLYLAAAVGGADPTAVVDVLLGVGADGGRLATASPPVAAVILVRVCVLVPMAEELLFRGVLFAWLRQRLAPGWTIAISAVMFGLMHQLPAFIPLATLVGVAAAWVREKTGSTVVPVAIHVAQNVVVVLVSLLVTGWDATLPMG